MPLINRIHECNLWDISGSGLTSAFLMTCLGNMSSYPHYCGLFRSLRSQREKKMLPLGDTARIQLIFKLWLSLHFRFPIQEKSKQEKSGFFFTVLAGHSKTNITHFGTPVTHLCIFPLSLTVIKKKFSTHGLRSIWWLAA